MKASGRKAPTAVRLLPNGYDRQYNVVDMNYALAEVYYRMDSFSQSITVLDVVLHRSPAHARANFLMAMCKAWLGETETALPYFDNAVRAEPRLAQLPDFFDLLSRNFVQKGLFIKGLTAAEKGRELALAAGRPDQADRLRERAEYCRSHR